MAIVTMNYLLKKAQRGKYIVGAFNFPDLASIQGIFQAASAKKSPVILMPAVFTNNEMGMEMTARAIEVVSRQYPEIDAAIHLDHCKDFDYIRKCIDYGYTSVMIDASEFEFNENVDRTCQVVEYARRYGVTVEAELGHISGQEDNISVDAREALFTSPEEAKKFVELTQVDALAIAVGTSYGFYKALPKLDFTRIKAIREITDVALVLHGGTGVPDDDFRKARELGISKVNVGTEIKVHGNYDVRKAAYAVATHQDPRVIDALVRAKTQELVEKKLEVFGSAGKL